MKFSVDKSLFEKAIMTSIGAVSSKTAIPALEGLLIEAGESTLTITGYDLELAIVCKTEAEIAIPGAIVVPAGKLSEIVRALPEDNIVISTADGGKVDILSGPVKFSIIGSPAAEYPELPSFSYRDTIKLSQNTLSSMIRQTVYAVATTENKPVYTGCLFEAEGEYINVVGVDGYRLALRKEKIEAFSDEKISFIVPGRALQRLLRMTGEGEETVTINVAERNALFETENTVLITRLLEGEFLNYRNAIPKEGIINIKGDVQRFTDSIKRASLIINEKQRSPVRLKFSEDEVRLSCSSPIGKFEDSFQTESSGGELEIGFNNKYLLDAFSNTREDTVRIELKDHLSPIVIRPMEGEAFTFLVLPVRLKTED